MSQTPPETARPLAAVNPADIQALVAQGKLQGYVTLDELLQVITAPEDAAEAMLSTPPSPRRACPYTTPPISTPPRRS